MSRFLTCLAALLFAAPAVLAQDAPDLATLIAHPDAQMLSAEEAAALGVASDGPVWVVPASVVEAPSLGYEIPASVLPAEKDAGLAIIIGILLPGGGQIYAGDTTKGLTILGLAYGSLIGSWVLASALDTGEIALLGWLAYVGFTVYGVLQATDDVEAANRRNGYAFAPSVVRTDRGTAVGMALRASF